MALQVGSVVIFVLGSPEMIVYKTSTKKVKCKWFCHEGRLHHSSFNIGELILTGQNFDSDRLSTQFN